MRSVAVLQGMPGLADRLAGPACSDSVLLQVLPTPLERGDGPSGAQNGVGQTVDDGGGSHRSGKFSSPPSHPTAGRSYLLRHDHVRLLLRGARRRLIGSLAVGLRRSPARR